MQQLRALRFEWEDPTAAEMLLGSIDVAAEHGAAGTILNAEFSAGSSSVTAVDRGMVFQQSPHEANWELQPRRRGSPPSDPMIDAPSVLPGLSERLQAWREWYFHFAPVRTGPAERSPLRNVVAKLDPTGANLAQALLYHQSRSSTIGNHATTSTSPSYRGFRGAPARVAWRRCGRRSHCPRFATAIERQHRYVSGPQRLGRHPRRSRESAAPLRAGAQALRWR